MIKIGSFFEEHVEKMVLVIIGLVCAWLLITRVIFSPNEVQFGEDKYSPGAIDEKVYEEAELLRQKLDDPPNEGEPYKSRLPEFIALLDSSISDIDTNRSLPVPYVVNGVTKVAPEGGRYRLPRIGEISDVAVEHIRAVAYVPTVPVTEDEPYDKSANEPNDIDLVTVEGKFDIQGLYDRFRYSFIEDVTEEWADPCLAKPVFAAVQLQRQELGGDGNWSVWQNVPRSKVDHNAKLCEMVENADESEAGRLKVWKLQFEDLQLQIDLLQPVVYQIASAREEWFPPSLHGKFLDFQRREILEEKRKTREEERERDSGRDEGANSRRPRRTDARIGGTTGRTGGRGAADGLGSGGLYGGGQDTTRRRSTRSGSSRRRTADSSLGGRTTDRRSRGRADQGGIDDYLISGLPRDRNVRRGPSMNDVYIEFDNISLTRRIEFDKMREPLVFWAHDDTAEPRKSYRYRIRLGIFNPVAGTNQLVQQDMARKNQVVLWSEFSDVTEPVEIPGKLYFFAKNVREASKEVKEVTVQVSKYLMGYWRSEDFRVSQGETIGGIVESEPESRSRSSLTRSLSTRSQSTMYLPDTRGLGRGVGLPTRTEDEVVMPETIDYSTGAVLVDVVDVNDWSGDTGLSTRRYYDMLYSFDGANIEHMPVRKSYWAVNLKDAFNRISRKLNEEPEPLKPWGSSGRRRRTRGDDLYEGYGDELYQDMMPDDMGGRRF